MAALDPTSDEAIDADAAILFEQIQNALLGHGCCAALQVLTESLAGVVAQAADTRAEADRLLTAIGPDLRTAFEAHWADPRGRSAASAFVGRA